LTFNIPAIFEFNTSWTQKDRKLEDAAWNALRLDDGVIVLDQETIDRFNLPAGQDYVWDSSKKVYYIHGYHLAHCLSELRQSIKEAYTSVPQTQDYWHLAHCLDMLRQDVECKADDTPLNTMKGQMVGIGQSRVCRDFKKLEGWVKDRSACYDSHKARIPGATVQDGYTLCPENSPYQAKIDEWLNNRKIGEGKRSLDELEG